MVNLLKLQGSISWRKVCPLSHCERSCAIIATSISNAWIACPSACRGPLSCDCVLFCWYNLLNKALLFTFLNWNTMEKTWPLRSFTLVTALELWRCFKLSFSVLQNILDKRMRVEVKWEFCWQLYFMQSCKKFTQLPFFCQLSHPSFYPLTALLSDQILENFFLVYLVLPLFGAEHFFKEKTKSVLVLGFYPFWVKITRNSF